MKKCDLKLKELIQTVVLPDIEDNIDDIFEQIANKKNASDELNKELVQMHEMRDDFNEILKDIENKELDKEECQELYEEIKAMIDDMEFDNEL